jgi:hypothetical protein
MPLSTEVLAWRADVSFTSRSAMAGRRTVGLGERRAACDRLARSVSDSQPIRWLSRPAYPRPRPGRRPPTRLFLLFRSQQSFSPRLFGIGLSNRHAVPKLVPDGLELYQEG